MSYFPRILNRSGIYRHDGRPLWAYHLTEREFQLLISEIKNSARSRLDPRDCALYYAEWWKRMYNGGTPSKETIFKSINNGVWYSYWLNNKTKVVITFAYLFDLLSIISLFNTRNNLYLFRKSI